ncbi:hypothetical protein ACIQBJ_25285 [Kitasatospora sp. NPDC088391]|uniref:hypothetical protein n=1 Tax=Kitasatospora sp. NPDC088391 TaxID=3364074 RepID=UPI0037F36ABC
MFGVMEAAFGIAGVASSGGRVARGAVVGGGGNGDGDRMQDAGAVVEQEALRDAPLVTPQVVAAGAEPRKFVGQRVHRAVLFVDGEQACAGESVPVHAAKCSVVASARAAGWPGR